MAALLALAARAEVPVVLPGEPTAASVVYYNARMALREGQPLEAVKLWMLRTALGDQTGRVSPYDADFRSVTWAALGDAGLCQDGYATDEDGAGLWPLALHNWVVRNLGRRIPPKRAKLFEAFEIGHQQRFVGIGDVLSAGELSTVHLFRARCARAQLMLINAGEPVNAKLADRHVAARLLQILLQRSRTTLAHDHVRGQAAVEARLFDVDLQLTEMAAQEARQQARQKAQHGRRIGLSKESVAAMTAESAPYTFSEDSEPARILKGATKWSAEEWMTLTVDRRLFLFDRARAYGDDPAALDQIALGIIDRSIDRREGAEVDRWIPRVAGLDPEEIWSGLRGERLLGLGRDSGFHERAVIALHRGVRSLEEGDLPNALRSLAYALQAAPESRSSEEVQSLSRRWLSYAAAQFAVTDELLATLQELVPRRDYGIVLEDLMWRAALRADQPSFQRGVKSEGGNDALARRLTLLEPLAAGNLGKFVVGIQKGLKESPSETMRFLGQLVQRLELEDADVRGAQVPMLNAVRRLLVPLAPEGGGTDSRSKGAATLLTRSQAILDGLGEPDGSAHDKARAMAPTEEVYAGSVRLAPSDPLPWPFQAGDVDPPSVFAPLTLTPEEWRDDAGRWVLGWTVGG